MTTTATNTSTMIFIRGWLDKCLETIGDDQMFRQPAPGCNHAMWVLGHLAWCDDAFRSSLGGAEATTPPEWKELFGYGSVPVADPAHYPSITEVRDAYAQTRERLMTWLEGMDEAKLDEPLPDDWKEFAPDHRTLMHAIAAHEGVHLGQITVIRKSLGMKPAMM